MIDLALPGHGLSDKYMISRVNPTINSATGRLWQEPGWLRIGCCLVFHRLLCPPASRTDGMTSGGLCASVSMSLLKLRVQGGALCRQRVNLGSSRPAIECEQWASYYLQISMGGWRLLGPTGAATFSPGPSQIGRRCTGGAPTSFPQGSLPLALRTPDVKELVWQFMSLGPL